MNRQEKGKKSIRWGRGQVIYGGHSVGLSTRPKTPFCYNRLEKLGVKMARYYPPPSIFSLSSLGTYKTFFCVPIISAVKCDVITSRVWNYIPDVRRWIENFSTANNAIQILLQSMRVIVQVTYCKCYTAFTNDLMGSDW